ncbi:MAG TPA: FMN-binding glutamate synthase family protein [Bacteroidetes bacterium]|nr:FMN-binding glutamate synthase family protein [Bacteroidota bacterium]
MRNEFTVFSILSLLIISAVAYFWWPPIIWSLVILLPVILLGIYEMFQSKHAIMRNYPVFGRGRYLMEYLRPKIYQYFIESDTDGTPISRIFRSVVYQRAKQVRDTAPFGTQLDVYEEGYEWVNHSIAALEADQLEHHPRITIGGPDCKQPYSCSILNVSAMSFGSLSKAAIMALNGGAKTGGFAHNTGEGGISPYHLEFGGDLIYQVGTGYFGSRRKDGGFSPEKFAERAALPSVKMIEIKLSQGAKPGHGGILPAKKNTPEIAAIRGVEAGKAVLSPPAHKAFSTPIEMMEFIAQMRQLSGGKPIGFKLCVGRKSEFIGICKAMIKTGIKPDFISVDGGEGGTGAAPLEFSNSVGMPFREGLSFVYDTLVGFGLKKDIKIITSGKILTGFHMFRAIALGADVCYSARAMMLALGCIQALECNKNNCPTGVATQDPELVKGLVVSDKKQRVASFHKNTVHAFVELMAAAGIDHPDKINRTDIYHRISKNEIKRYDEVFPYIAPGCLLKEETIPENWKAHMAEARAESFKGDLQLS